MTAELATAAGLGLATTASLLTTPVAIRTARRTGLLDRPREYRRHKSPTPFLGGAAVLAAFALAALAVGAFASRLWIVVALAGALWALGTFDDRYSVPPRWRLLAEVVAAILLSIFGLGWASASWSGFGVLLTIVWVVGLTNAFNLMDNMDGSCATVACASALGIGTLAWINGLAPVAGLAFAVAGAVLGFLRFNLARPARIFLGDGGSMPIGFVIAALAMITGRHLHLGHASLLVGAMLVGLPILDTALVSVSRIRRGVSLSTGGHDHLTYRLLLRLRTPQAVAGALALLQLGLCGLAITGDRLGTGALVAIACSAAMLGMVVIALLDTAAWRPSEIAMGKRAGVRRQPSPAAELAGARREIGADSS